MNGAVKLAKWAQVTCERDDCTEEATLLIMTNGKKMCLCPAHIDEPMLNMVLGR